MKNYKLNSNFLSKETEEEVILLDIEDENDMIFSFKNISVDFWKLIKQDMATNDIIENICTNYDIDKKTVKENLDDFILHLKKIKVLI